MASNMDTSNRSNVDQTPFPAPAQLALAFFVLKSKPSDATVEDHLNRLQTHVIRGNATVQGSPSQNLDGAAYWKQAYEQAEEEKAALLDRVYELEKHNAVSMILSSPVARSPLGKDRKRRREDTPAAKANSRLKRRANASKTTESPAKEGESVGGGNVLLTNEVSTGHIKLLQAFFALRVQLRRQRVDLPGILSSARRLCHTIYTIVKGVGHTAEAKDDSNTGAGLWEAMHRIYGSILEAMDLLRSGSTQSSSISALISDLGKVLTEMLNCLTALTLREQPQKEGVGVQRQCLDDKGSLAADLSKLIAYMITILDMNKEWHRQLFEALAYVFFERIGSSLSTAVFSEPPSLGRPSTIGLLQPRGPLATEEDKITNDLATTLKEAPHLVTILRTISLFANEKDSGRGNLLPSAHFNQKDGYGAAIIARMQNTMLRGMFGDQEEAFHDTLRRPSETESTDYTKDLMVGQDEEVTSEWFVGEVWKYIGWDILTKCVD